jgi:hypothetical protein
VREQSRDLGAEEMKLVWRDRYAELNPDEYFVGNVSLPKGKGINALTWERKEQFLSKEAASEGCYLINLYHSGGVTVGIVDRCKVVKDDYKLKRYDSVKRKYVQAKGVR